RYGHPRDPHSFPTRRSSDLGRATTAAVPRRALPVIACLPWCATLLPAVTFLDCSAGNAASPNLAIPLDVDAQGGVENLHALEQADRKSTRLNSSHRTISYAV